jgi:biotin-(acetyl-CoA carboxylase) ligase
VERTAGVVLVGIGINVGQREFPPDLDAHATSLARLGGRLQERNIHAIQNGEYSWHS